MKRLSFESRRGMTLVELLVAGTISALIIASVCGIYFSIARDSERQSGGGAALVATSQACSRIADYISQATSALVVNRFGTGDVLALNLPSDTAYGGTFIPVWTGGKVKYRGGSTWVVFYLSDRTGSFNVGGDILWAGVGTYTTSLTVTPDASWSLYYSGGPGRIAPLKSLQFSIATGGSHPRVTVNATSAYKIGITEAHLSQSTTVCVANSN